MNASSLIFGVLFPWPSLQKNRELSDDASHCLIRAMAHLTGHIDSTSFPSTKNGVIEPFDVKVS